METTPPGPDQPCSADPSPPAGCVDEPPAGSVAGTAPGSVAALPGPGLSAHAPACEQVAVTRIGTQVVVRLAGVVAEPLRARLHQAVGEVECLVVTRVVVDLDEVTELGAAGLDFVLTLQQRWPVRLLNAPDGLRRGLLARPAV